MKTGKMNQLAPLLLIAGSVACSSPSMPEAEHAVGVWTLDEGAIVSSASVDYLELGIDTAQVAFTINPDGSPQLEVTPGVGASPVACRIEQTAVESMRGPASAAFYEPDTQATFVLEGDWRYEQIGTGETLAINMSGTLSWTSGDIDPSPVTFTLRAHR